MVLGVSEQGSLSLDGWAHEGSRGIPLQADFPGHQQPGGASGVLCSVACASSASLASCTFPLIRNRASSAKAFPGASLTPSLRRGHLRGQFSAGHQTLLEGCVLSIRRLCWIPTRDRTPPTPGLALSLQIKNCNVNKIWISTIACGSSRVVVDTGNKGEVLRKPELLPLLEKTIK